MQVMRSSIFSISGDPIPFDSSEQPSLLSWGHFSVLRQKSLYFFCHSGLDPESSVSELDSRFRGNDGFGNNVKKC